MAEDNLALEVLKQMKDQHSQELELKDRENARLHIMIKRIIIAYIITSVVLVGAIVYCVYNSYLPSEETYSEEQVQQDNDNGNNNYIGEKGNINNGKTDNN